MNIEEKVTMPMFFAIQGRILQELYGKYQLETTAVILISCITMSAGFINLKFLEYATNSVSVYMSDGGDFRAQAIHVGVFLAALLVVQLLQNLYNVIREKYVSKISFEAEKKIVNKLSVISYEYYEVNAFHEEINLARGAGEQYADAVFGVTEIARVVWMLAVYGVMLSGIHVIYVAAIFLSIVVSAVVAARVTEKQLDFFRTHVSPEMRRNDYYKNVLKNRINHQNIQTQRNVGYFTQKYSEYNHRERRNFLKLNVLSFSTDMSTSLLFGVVFLATALIVGKGVASGVYEIGFFTMVIALLANLFRTIKQFSLFMLNQSWYVKVLSAYYEVLGVEEQHGCETTQGELCIELKDVRYRYPQAETHALIGASVRFNKGEKIAVVGHNGSGKTTLISMILSLLKNTGGEMTRYGAVQTAILQEFGQYQLSIRENIEIGCGGRPLPDDVIIDILKKVELYDWIAEKPDGINTKLGQLNEGVELSKGQWQRLAIGRLLANQEANVWILDEPAAYLDPLAEIDMYQFIFNLAGDRLVFFISHRLGFAKNADRIMVIDQGKIAESGTHRELMESVGSLYARMFEAQKEFLMS